MQDVWGPRIDWNTFDISTEGKKLTDFKDAWYNLYQGEGISTDLIVNFKNGDRKLMSSNIYWGKIRNPKNYKYYIGGMPIRKLYPQIKSIEAMHSLRNHPLCAAFWNKDENGVYCSFSLSEAIPTMNKIVDDLLSGKACEKEAITDFIDAIITEKREACWSDSEIIDKLIDRGFTKADFVNCGFEDFVKDYFNNDPDLDEMEPHISRAESLPEGWVWEDYIDGSGSLQSPEGKSYFSYDLSPYAAEGGIEYQNNVGTWGTFYGSLSEFKTFAEKIIDAALSQSKSSLTDKIENAQQRAEGGNNSVSSKQNKTPEL